jgi:inner membrane protein
VRLPGSARGRALLGPVLALAAIGLLDAVHVARPWPVPVAGLLDEPAHLLTAWLIGTAVAGARLRETWAGMLPWALVASVAIDVDHFPVYLWSAPIALPGSRPVTHSVVTVLVLLGVAAATRRPARIVALGLAAGVALHLVRDVATGPGIPLLWPADQSDVQLPYAIYLAVLVLATVGAVLRAAERDPLSATGGR